MFPFGKLHERSRSKIPKEERGADGKPQETLLAEGYVVFTQGRRWRPSLRGSGPRGGFLTENQNLGFHGGVPQTRPEARAT